MRKVYVGYGTIHWLNATSHHGNADPVEWDVITQHGHVIMGGDGCHEAK